MGRASCPRPPVIFPYDRPRIVALDRLDLQGAGEGAALRDQVRAQHPRGGHGEGGLGGHEVGRAGTGDQDGLTGVHADTAAHPAATGNDDGLAGLGLPGVDQADRAGPGRVGSGQDVFVIKGAIRRDGSIHPTISSTPSHSRVIDKPALRFHALNIR